MEKRCVSEAVVASLVKSEPAEVRPGFAIADAGMTNYCLCKEDLCNHDSLLAQAQISGVRKSEPAPKPKTPALEEVQAPENNMPKQPSPEVTHVFLDSDETPSVETSQVPEPREPKIFLLIHCHRSYEHIHLDHYLILAAPELPVVKTAPVPPAPTARQSELPPQVIAAVPSIHPVPKEQQTNSFPSPQSQQNRDRDEADLTPVPIEAVVHQGAGKVEQQIER
ncbi:hypothetical protein OSTOST_12607, partial [Ostertagia ostertagi]